jgi:hypothetical protein
MQNVTSLGAAKFSILIGFLLTEKYEIPKVDVGGARN